MYRLFMCILGGLGRLKIRNVSGIENLPKTPPVIIAANHVGFFDAPVMAIVLYRQYHQPIQFLTYDLMWKLWGGPVATRTMGMVRLNPRDKKGSLATMINIVRHGNVGAIFPEGERNHHPERLLSGKTGAVRMALATQAPVIPVGIRNTTGRTIGKAFASFLRPHTYIDIAIGTPVDFSEFQDTPITHAVLHDATRKLMLHIAEQAGVPVAERSV